MSDLKTPVRNFIKHHFRHFNAAGLVDAASAYENHLKNGGKMFITLAGAMSTAELGVSLAEMIRQEKVHGICCTGANLEEDVFNLVAHDYYERVPNYRDLSPEMEMELCKKGLNRVTDTCIPEEEAMRRIEAFVLEEWREADRMGETHPPHFYLWKLFEKKVLDQYFQIDKKDSWLYAAWERNIPIFTPGWEDSTLGNKFAADVMTGPIKSSHVVENGIELMTRLVGWYREISANCSIGFFQIGGGIAGDFPICVVPLLEQDMKIETPLWGYFCQISDSTTSYGSYSGAVPNEKITWGKLDIDTPRFVIESDATIVAPLVFAYVLNW
ncbi:MAG: deoxyhypusine synthase family protein [Bacteriovoracaceae bacterium]|nr:deoxyhypusine synthase family protein [Bacteriovoracaceae bacterium]